FEDRSLFDVALEERADLAPTAGSLASVADLGKRGAERHAIAVGFGLDLILLEDAGEDARAHHRRRESRAFLIGPNRDLDRSLGLDAGLVERAQHLESGHHPVSAVELAAGRLRVDVAAGHHRRPCRIAALAAREDVAHAVDADRGTRPFAPAREEIPGLAVEI